VEARLPYLDHVVHEKAAGLPVAAFHEGGHSKAILREALRGVMPEGMRLRPKHPFIAPPLLAGDDPVVREFVHDTLSSAALPFFDAAAVKAWLKQPVISDPVLMQLLSFTLIAKAYRL
jgi:asparagine synthase (glutamine-hydrolysing)